MTPQLQEKNVYLEDLEKKQISRNANSFVGKIRMF